MAGPAVLFREIHRLRRFANELKEQIDRYPRQVTAQQAKAYKPEIANFELLLQRLGIARERLLHVAESLYHDVLPARSLGIATVWVNRRQGKTAAASRLADVRPDLEVKNVAALADIAGC